MKKSTEAAVVTLLKGTMITVIFYGVTLAFPPLILFFLGFLPALFGFTGTIFQIVLLFTVQIIPGALFAGFSSASYRTGSIIGMGSGLFGFAFLLVALIILDQSMFNVTPLVAFFLPVAIVSFGLGAFGVMLAKRLKPAWKQWVAS